MTTNIDLYKETYPYVNLWVLEGRDLEIFWDDETKSLIRIYLDDDLYWKSDENLQSLDQSLKALNEFLLDEIYSEGAQGEDYTEDWKHSD